jgi:hypothetical protein
MHQNDAAPEHSLWCMSHCLLKNISTYDPVLWIRIRKDPKLFVGFGARNRGCESGSRNRGLNPDPELPVVLNLGKKYLLFVLRENVRVGSGTFWTSYPGPHLELLTRNIVRGTKTTIRNQNLEILKRQMF